MGLLLQERHCISQVRRKGSYECYGKHVGLARSVCIRFFWQVNHQIYGHVWCIYTVFLAGKSPNIRSCMVYVYDFFGR